MQPRITFVEQFYYPEGWGGAQIPRDITMDLVRAGYQVSVYCGSDQYVSTGSEGVIDPTQFGVSIKHIPSLRVPFRVGKRVLRQLWFCLFASIAIILRPRPSAYIVQTNPPLIVVVLSWIAAIRRTPLVIIAQDVYPEVMIAHGMLAKSSILSWILKSIFRVAYRRAECVVSLGPRMTTRLIEKGVLKSRTCEISNWATGNLTLVRDSRREMQGQDLSDKFVLVYSGNLGIAHDVDTLIRAVALALPASPQVRVLVIGTGSRIAEAQRLVKGFGLCNQVLFSASVSSEQLPRTLGLADVALVTLLPEFSGLVVPSKLLGYMARGLPTLYVGPPDGDVAQLIAKSQGGISIRNGNVEELSSSISYLANNTAVLKHFGQMAANYYQENLAREKGLFHYRLMLEAVLKKNGAL
jgi:colanic acid biosynthesis glycosyl transferase WcaI